MGADRCVSETTYFIFEKLGRLVPWLVGELERTPVDAENVLRANVGCDLHSFGWIGVLAVHEPAGCVGSYGEHCNKW